MIRRSTVVWFSLAAVVGYAMYQLKYDVAALEEDLGQRNREILAYQESIHVLKAEWAYLNEPGRLQELAQLHLDLHPISEAKEIAVAMIALEGVGPAADPAIPTPRLKPTLTAALNRGTQ